MAKLFSVASWNVEHFSNDTRRIGRVIDFLAEQNPDLVGLYEVEGSKVFAELVARMPGYVFQITEGPQSQEILVGVKKNLTAFITQKLTFKSGTTHMRPGQLVTVAKDGVNYSLLFLHLTSGSDPRGMGLRDDMLERAFDFRKTLDKAQGGAGAANYIFLGDLNTMGMKFPFDRNIEAELELKKWDNYAKRKSIGMRRLAKSHPASWSNGTGSSYPPSNLDHVYASTNLRFRTFGGPADHPVEADLRGWVSLPPGPRQDAWLAEFSDHALVYFELVS